MVFWFLIYLPNQKSALKIKSELYALEEQVKIIEEILSKTKTIESSRKLLEARFQRLTNKFSSKEAEALKMLSELARRVNIEVISVKPQPKKPFLDEDNRKIEIAGKSVQVIHVYMEMKCFYKDLARYLELLNENPLALEMIKRLKITREKPTTRRLNIVLELDLYF